MVTSEINWSRRHVFGPAASEITKINKRSKVKPGDNAVNRNYLAKLGIIKQLKDPVN